MYCKKKKKGYRKPASIPTRLHPSKTGEDIDMLHESSTTLGSDSLSYKDHIDGA